MLTSPEASPPLSAVAVFGTGPLGLAVLRALLRPLAPGYKPKVYAFVRPGHQVDKFKGLSSELRVVENDYNKENEELVEKLRGIDAIVSTLSGPGIEVQFLAETSTESHGHAVHELIDVHQVSITSW